MSTTFTTPETAGSGFPHELHEPLQALKRYGIPAASILALALVAGLGFAYYRSRGEAGKRDALMLMSSAKSYDDLERVVSNYGRTPAAPLAMLKIAHAYFNDGNYALARDKYAAFTATYATHPFAAIAELGVLHCDEAQGKTDEALRGFEGFATQHPDHYLVAEATLGQARCLEQLGRLTQARMVYEQFLATHSQSAWFRHVEQLLRKVNKDIAAGRDGATPIPTAAAAEVQKDFFAPMGISGSAGPVEEFPPPAAATP